MSGADGRRPRSFWARVALLTDGPAERVRVSHRDGTIVAVESGVDPHPQDERLGVVLPGLGNAHSHAFHRLLRGRTHGEGGDFWRWREAMYRAAGALEPDRYRLVATAVFGEMVASGWTAVGEFHYVHHRADGSPYPDHDMARALADAAEAVGIRLTLLDTCYLAGGIGSPLAPEQRRFGDGSVHAWLERWTALRELLDGRAGITLGAAVHSVRAVAPDDIAVVAAQLPEGVPLHVHVSEQPRENEDCLAAYGDTPTGVLGRTGVLARAGVSLVHATHLTEADIAAIGAARSGVVFCPTTEADLGDGIGPARALADAGAILALGSDQNAVVDPLLEIRGLEAHERLASGARGRFDPAELLAAAATGGYRSLGLSGGILPGSACDLVEVSDTSARTVGSLPAQLVLTATAADVTRVVVGGRTVARDGRLESGQGPADPARLLQDAMEGLLG